MDYSNYNAGIDTPDSRDIPVTDILDMVAILPRQHKVGNVGFLNQGAIGACTVFGSSGALFATSYDDATRNGTPYNQPYDPWKVWDKAKERGASDTKGWSIQGAIQLIHDLKYSIGYAKVANSGNTDPTPLKQAINSGYAIATGSQYGDWGKIIISGEYREKSTPSGHIYCLDEYNDDHIFTSGEVGGFHSPNSWGGKGEFWIAYSQINRLYSTYIQLDPSDIQAMKDIRNARAKNYADDAKNFKIWNGENPNTIATAEEIRIMLGRALNIMGDRSRQYWSTIFEDKILRGKGLVTIWNEKEGARNAKSAELAIMFTRAVKRDAKLSTLSLTRFQVASVIGRDILG